jgi:hypothetical protein
LEGQHCRQADAGVLADFGDVSVKQIEDLQVGGNSVWVVSHEGGEAVHEGGEDGAKVDAALEVGDALEHDFKRFHVEFVGEDLEHVMMLVLRVVLVLVMVATWMIDSSKYCCAILSLQVDTCSSTLGSTEPRYLITTSHH